METESFASAPISLTEARADKAHRGDLWTPRDVLISMLRDIDKGVIAPEGLVVAWYTVDPKTNDETAEFRTAVKSPYIGLGLLEDAKRHYID